MANNPIVFLFLSSSLFVLGLITILTRRNIIGVLMGIELMLNASGINFITFSFFKNGFILVSGHVFTVFIIVLGASEVVIALAIILAMYHQQNSISIENLKDLKG
jgi:NADH:ubiquinone oxidoreductase subunit K